MTVALAVGCQSSSGPQPSGDAVTVPDVGTGFTALAVHGQELIAGSDTNQLFTNRSGQIREVSQCDSATLEDQERPEDMDIQDVVLNPDGYSWALAERGVWWRSPDVTCWVFQSIEDGYLTKGRYRVDGSTLTVEMDGVAVLIAPEAAAPIQHLDDAPGRPETPEQLVAGQGATIPNTSGENERALVFDVVREERGTFAATNKGLWFAPAGTTAPSDLRLLADGAFHSVVGHGNSILGANREVLVTVAPDLSVTSTELALDALVNDMAVAPEGTVWFATSSGLENLPAHFSAAPDASPSASPQLDASTCLDADQKTRWGSGNRAQQPFRFGGDCFVLVTGGLGLQDGVLATQRNSWVVINDTITAIAKDPAGRDLLWIATPEGLLLVEPENRQHCDAFADGCDMTTCAGPETGCSVFRAADGLPSNEIIGLHAMAGQLIVETTGGFVAHHDDHRGPDLQVPFITDDGTWCEDCLNSPIRWNSDLLTLTPAATDLGDLRGLGFEVHVNGARTATGSNGTFEIRPVPKGRYEVRVTPIDRHFNRGQPVTYPLTIDAEPVLSRLARPYVLIPGLLLLVLGGILIWRKWDLEPVNVVRAHVRPHPDGSRPQLNIDLQVDRSWRALRRRTVWQVSLDPAAEAIAPALSAFVTETRRQQQASRKAGEAAYSPASADELAVELARLIDPAGRLSRLVRRPSRVLANKSKDTTTRLTVSVADADSHEVTWLAHNLPWERLTDATDPEVRLGDHGLVVVRLSNAADITRRSRPDETSILLASVDQPDHKQAVRPLNRLESVTHYQSLTNSKALQLARLQDSDDFSDPLIAGPTAGSAVARSWDIVRLHAHGAPQLVHIGKAMAGAVDWAGVRDNRPTLWLLMACNVGAPAVWHRTLKGGRWQEHTERGLAHELIGGESPLGRYAIGFNTEVDLTSIESFETLLLELIGRGRQLDVAVRAARRSLDHSDNRFAIRIYANDPSLLLNER